MAKSIAFFNNKGGVSKTTTCYNLGWMLAEQGHRVLMVDADPQCNLTGMVIDLAGENALDTFYEANPNRNLREALEPAFKSRPRALEAVECLAVPGRDGLYLIPGHVGMAEDEVSLGIAQQLSETIQALKNVPGSFKWLFSITAAKYEADYVLIDLSPGLGAINQNLVTTADFFIMPTSPDVFSVMAIDSLSRVVPRWMTWARAASKLEALSSADYPFPEPRLRFLGTIVQRYRLKGGLPTVAFRTYFDQLESAVSLTLAPAFQRSGLMLPPETYAAAGVGASLRLASIPDFNTLIANSQQVRKPVFTLTQADVRRGGFVWATQSQNIANFRTVFEELASEILALTA